MSLVKYFNKFRRELYKPLSKVCLQQAKTNYFGLNLTVPILNGLGAGFLVLGDKWMSDCLAVFLKLKQGTVIDIGVNLGLYMIKLKALDQSRDYIGFEPNPVCNNFTQELIRANSFRNVRILPFALSDKKELRQFYIRRKGDKMGSLNEYARYGDADKFSFELFTFPGDDFFDLLSLERLCVMKIDVEGAELEVLAGLNETLKRYKPYLFCEIWQLPDASHPTYTEKLDRLGKICDLLKNIDYRILGVSISDPSNIFQLKSPVDFDGSHRRDFVLVHVSEESDLRQTIANI